MVISTDLISTVSFFLYHVTVTVFCLIFSFRVSFCVLFCLAWDCDMKMSSRKGTGPNLVIHYCYSNLPRDSELYFNFLLHTKALINTMCLCKYTHKIQTLYELLLSSESLYLFRYLIPLSYGVKGSLLPFSPSLMNIIHYFSLTL